MSCKKVPYCPWPFKSSICWVLKVHLCVTSSPTRRMLGDCPKTKSAASVSPMMLASAHGVTLPLQKKAPPRTTSSCCEANSCVSVMKKQGCIMAVACMSHDCNISMKWCVLCVRALLGKIHHCIVQPGCTHSQNCMIRQELQHRTCFGDWHACRWALGRACERMIPQDSFTICLS